MLVINPGLGDKLIVSNTDNVLASHAPKDEDEGMDNLLARQSPAYTNVTMAYQISVNSLGMTSRQSIFEIHFHFLT